MGAHGGTRVKNATHLKQASMRAGNRTVLVHPLGIENPEGRMLVHCDITSDAEHGWHLAIVAYPRVETPYVSTSVRTNNQDRNGSVPSPVDSLFTKIADTDMHLLMNSGIKQTRTQWWHTSVEFGSVWGDGSLSNDSTLFNLFENPSAWVSDGQYAGQRFKRRTATETEWSDWITTASGTCSSMAGGWSNWYEQSCIRSWFAGCEGGPAYNHRCAGVIQDRAEKLLVWVA